MNGHARSQRSQRSLGFGRPIHNLLSPASSTDISTPATDCARSPCGTPLHESASPDNGEHQAATIEANAVHCETIDADRQHTAEDALQSQPAKAAGDPRSASDDTTADQMPNKAEQTAQANTAEPQSILAADSAVVESSSHSQHTSQAVALEPNEHESPLLQTMADRLEHALDRLEIEVVHVFVVRPV